MNKERDIATEQGKLLKDHRFLVELQVMIQKYLDGVFQRSRQEMLDKTPEKLKESVKARIQSEYNKIHLYYQGIVDTIHLLYHDGFIRRDEVEHFIKMVNDKKMTVGQREHRMKWDEEQKKGQENGNKNAN